MCTRSCGAKPHGTTINTVILGAISLGIGKLERHRY
ncbi:hypothetical protein AWB69_08541 [Caballeronia udeis]|uniref:Uncharacterized protein n=1 Tax=Caballeronia udeis TaxID=1232866 RepID=A0A158JRK9_9BURK|nr:hypothetical protein AWB69_08541 [Caballeronia udeis]